jgi:hypothetical protein
MMGGGPIKSCWDGGGDFLTFKVDVDGMLENALLHMGMLAARMAAVAAATVKRRVAKVLMVHVM